MAFKLNKKVLELFTAEKIELYYAAFLEKKPNYEGVFFVGVKTTGVFCRPTCPARKPKLVNCEFFENAEQALLASYRPCKRCTPLCYPGETSDIVKKLVAAIESNPEKRWNDKDFEELSIDAVMARRHFNKRFGMTFVAYARARRMGLAFKQIRKGVSVIDSQLDAGYDSDSGFRDAFSKIMGAPPSKANGRTMLLKASWIDTKLGPMIAIADNEGLYLLKFIDKQGLEIEIEKLRSKTGGAIIPGESAPLLMIKKELDLYFSGHLKQFKTPLHMIGTDFQKKAWQALIHIPFGETRSYLDQAKSIGNERAFRAVANANGANQLSIVVPCHRIINSNGALGGYGGGQVRKQWLIDHEKKSL